MKISVIVPVYNVGKLVLRSIEGIESQDFSDFEVILVNDGSTDDSRRWCEQLVNEYENITLITQLNQGSGAARNTGLDHAKGEYIYFFDPDDYLTGEFFQSVVKQIEDQPDVVVYGYWDEVFHGEKMIKRVPTELSPEETFDQTSFRKAFNRLFHRGGMYTLWNKVYRRKFLEDHEIRFTTAPMGQDVRFNYLVYRALDSIRFVPEKYYHYVVSRSTSSTNRYRDNRLTLQLEEWEQLKQLMETFGQVDSDLLLEEKTKVMKANVNHIAMSQLPREEKYQHMQEVVEHPAFQDIYEDNPYLDRLSELLLTRDHYPTYDLLYRTARKQQWLYDGLRNVKHRMK
ncbi:MAG: glycosyltransferase family 2 protein [Aerococcus sp.]|nr:glycosyltransferase family 2 protein [Aerococcus sp.]